MSASSLLEALGAFNGKGTDTLEAIADAYPATADHKQLLCELATSGLHPIAKRLNLAAEAHAGGRQRAIAGANGNLFLLSFCVNVIGKRGCTSCK